jgi:tetratricopeptide (TPR) repeat protein
MARNAELNREVALKFIKPERAGEPDSLRRFLQEAEVTGRLEHPGVVPIYALGTDADGSPCYAMRFIRGTTLQDAIDAFHAVESSNPDRSERSLALRELLTRFASVCSTMAYAHSRGILHRDLKPRNVMLGKYDETLVVDWGLAKPFERDESARVEGEETLLPGSGSGSGSDTPTLGVVGTPAYMSPEQAEGRWDVVGPASDLFGLGAILYTILTGRPPYQGRKIGELLEKVKRCDYRKPRDLKAGIPRALEAICQKAMGKRIEDRYATALDLAEDVRRWLADEPVTAWREPRLVRARRWMWLHRTGVAAAAVALLAGLIGLGTVAAVQARANRLLRRANLATTRALNETRQAQTETQLALAQSEASRTRAEESRAQAEAVTRFLVDAFRSPDPFQTGRDVKVVDVLDRAALELDKEFSGSAATKGALLNALGSTYHGLGLYGQAADLHRQARAVREHALGADHPDTLRSSASLALDYVKTGRLPEAIVLNEATLKSSEATLGAFHPDTLKVRHNLALAYLHAERSKEAIALFEATLRVFEARLGGDDPSTLAVRGNLALAYWNSNRVPEAIALSETTLKLAEAKLGPDHPRTVGIRNNLAIAYWSAGRLNDAIALQEATLKVRESKLGLDHPETLSTRHNLGISYAVAGRFSQALPLFEATLKASEAKLGPDATLTLNICGSLANVYGTLGRSSDVEALRRRIVAGRRKTVKPDSPILADDLADLGRHLIEQSRWSSAEPVLRDALAIGAKTTPDDWKHCEVMSLLGAALLGQRRYAEAEPLVISGYTGMKARDAKVPMPERSHLLNAAERVVHLYEGWNKPEEAAAWKITLGLPDLPADVFALIERSRSDK